MENSLRDRVLAFAAETFGTEAEYPWNDMPESAVLRHSGSNKKWYGLVMNVSRSQVGLKGEGRNDVLNVKCDPLMIGSLRSEDGFFPAYHMNKENWISISLDGTVDPETVNYFLGMSFELTDKKTKAKKRIMNREWLIPANPKYYDIIEGFSKTDIHTWKQSSNVIPGDIIYIYLAAPYSAVYCKCLAIETDIPSEYEDKNIKMKKIMKLKLLHIFEKDELTREKLMDLGVYSVRGPRSVPPELHAEISAIIGETEDIE